MDRPNRSHPTLTPLTSLPTSPHASTSYLYPITSIPTTPSLLSRPSSQTRLRPVRSAPTPVLVPTSSSTSTTTVSPKPTQKKIPTRTTTTINGADDNDDWLTRTASTLTLTRLEEKGQSWLAARHSSTSLNGGADEYDEARSPAEHCWSRSRARSARGSEARLQGLRLRGQDGIRMTGGGGGDGTGDAGEGDDGVRPDFVDVDAEEELEEEGGWAEGEGEGEVVDEGEMRRVVLGRVGGWVDWAVGWMDFRGEGEGEEEEEVHGDGREGEGAARGKDGGAGGKGELDAVELQKRLRRKKWKDVEAETGGEGANAVGSAPETAGFWGDAKWLLGVAAKAAL